ncbi:Kelch_1 domain-containing protein/F-box-like domain-containing protein [Cephalotus follicularis]|uniref:Kelch_1 domain-containing protein/F-box-like domain-containing protein n=1 Tax=Cephalotus follicularis TaxID=3775 RepID=A0A1Q3B187_CEPFO|nr:Kelch_1 domain-containing protein/F-box-like domain-containing protein [Cephalotus follicularis]
MTRRYESSSSSASETLTLIPGLPNDIAAQILSYIPYSHQPRVKSTCKSWRAFLSSETLFSLRYERKQRLSHLLCIFTQDPSISSPHLFDPVNLAWCPLPPMPCNPHAYGLCNFAALSLGPHLYVLGGSLFDTRSIPLDRPLPSSTAFRFSFLTSSWYSLAPMITPRGSFACAAVPDSGQIIVAGGGSRHTMFGAAGSRICSVERYDVERDEWVALDGLPRFRAGCVGFFAGNGVEDREFWVMGGYGESRTVSGVFPVDEHYIDAVVMDGYGKWREVGDMWREGERTRVGKIAVVDDENGGVPAVFMLDREDIFRYDMALNRWQKESSVPRKSQYDKPFGFVVLDGELYVLTLLKGIDSTETRRSRYQKRPGTLFIQIYNPRKKSWRSLVTKTPFHHPLELNTAVMCTIRL